MDLKVRSQNKDLKIITENLEFTEQNSEELNIN